jgi:hypothetical protein
MRAFIFTFLSSTSFLLFSQEFEAEKYIASQIGRVSDSALVQWTLDSLQLQLEREKEQSLHLYGLQLKKTKDECLLVFHFLGEGCGAYCNPFYRSIIAIKNETENYAVLEQDLFEMQIDSIVVLEANRFYLAFGKSSGRP